MIKSYAKPHRMLRRLDHGQTSVRMMFLALGCILLGAGAATVWLRGLSGQSASNVPSDLKSRPSPELSDATKAILSHLNSPVELRFYSLLDPSNTPDSLRSFAARVDVMLNTYQEASAGKLTVKRYDSQAYSSASTATADGIKPFNTQNGNPSFLGVAVVQGTRKQTLPQLSPVWETALEADLSRAIAQLNEAPAAETPTMAPQVNPATAEEVKRLLPNYNSISLEEGTRTLREAALKQFKETATELQNQLRQAEQTLSQAQASGSAADQQTAMKNLQQLQTQQTERLKEIAANSQAQIEAFRRLKTATP